MSKYIRLDVHQASCTMVILGPSGKKLGCHVVQTNAKLLVNLLKGIPTPRHLCFEEGTQSAWLYETLAPHVDETVVTVKRERRGSKDDQRDALELAERLRTNSIEVRVYKEVGRYGRLRELSKMHLIQVRDRRIVSILPSSLTIWQDFERAVKRPSRAPAPESRRGS